MTNDEPASNIGAMAPSPNIFENKFTPPKAAMICGITMNILNKPIMSPILSSSTELESIAYGIDKILPHENPINIKDKFKYDGLGKKLMLKKPTPPAISENMCTYFRLIFNLEE